MPKEASPPTTTDSQRPQQKQSPNGKANRVTFASTVGSDSGGGGGVGGGGGNKRSLSLDCDVGQSFVETSPSSSAALPTRQLQCIVEDPDNPPAKSSEGAASSSAPGAESTGEGSSTGASKQGKQRRAHMVKKAIRYFEDKSNRSVSEDNLFTRRKNLAVHLGLDDTVSKREVQKINTYSLPVPSSASPNPDSALKNVIVVEDNSGEEDLEEELKGKNLVQWLGMKDGISASMASQGSICFPRQSSMRGASSSSSSSSAAAASKHSSTAEMLHRRLGKGGSIGD